MPFHSFTRGGALLAQMGGLCADLLPGWWLVAARTEFQRAPRACRLPRAMQALLPGTEVTARGLRWEVVFVQPAGDQSIYRLRCLEGGTHLQGREVDLLVPFEPVTAVASELSPTLPGRLQDWRVYHDAFLLEQCLGPDALLAAQPGRLQVAPYQLVPVMRALALPRPRLLLADDVGLGKTIEAGLVLAEFIARRLAHRVLIVSPAGPLMTQWQTEMRERFGLRFRVLDADALKEIRYGQELGANPFDHEALGLISIDFAKQERILQDIERSHYDLVIIDEAHHCVSLGAAGDRDDSLRRRLAEVLARRADGLLLLTATPHDGNEAHFASLLELLDPSLVNGRGELRGKVWERHVVRRLKRHIRGREGEALFREREVFPVAVKVDRAKTPLFASFQVALLALVAPVLQRAMKKREFGEVLAFVSLLKRSVSTAAACASTLDVVAARLEDVAQGRKEPPEARQQRVRTLRDMNRRIARFGALSADEQRDQAQIEAEELAATLTAIEPVEMESLLASMADTIKRARKVETRAGHTGEALRLLAHMAREAQGEDPKLRELVAAILAIRAKEPRANILVYSEYVDSQNVAIAALNAAIARKELTGEVLELSGDAQEALRARVTTRFTEDDDLVLVSTDASAEGLNLHQRCHHLLHLELPYNPNRLEQRNGRIDRFGQKHDPQVRYLYLEGTFEERLLLRLASRYEQQRKRLGFVPNTLGATFPGAEGARGESLVAGIADESRLRFEQSLAPVVSADLIAQDKLSPAYADMLDEIDQVLASAERVARTHAWVGDAGLQAEQRLVDAATQARTEGKRLGVVDLLQFVIEAVRADSADARPAQEVAPGRWELKLPPAWHPGLDDVPGWDPSTGMLRLTTHVQETHDVEKHALGYLGRAHPIVRRALDRVRNIQHGGGEHHLDRRVAVAQSDIAKPAVIYTFLGRVQGGAGREFERVLAVRLDRGAEPVVLDDVSVWSELAAAPRAVSPKGVWEQHFAAWASTHPAGVQELARAHFEALTNVWRPRLDDALDADRKGIAEWLRVRSDELCGSVEKQPALFGDVAFPRWKTLTDPAQRLAAFATDARNVPSARGDARTVLEIHQRRAVALDRRGALEAPTVTMLGMLLLAPAGGARAA